jgi:hypothetical protein
MPFRDETVLQRAKTPRCHTEQHGSISHFQVDTKSSLRLSPQNDIATQSRRREAMVYPADMINWVLRLRAESDSSLRGASAFGPNYKNSGVCMANDAFRDTPQDPPT